MKILVSAVAGGFIGYFGSKYGISHGYSFPAIIAAVVVADLATVAVINYLF